MSGPLGAHPLVRHGWLALWLPAMLASIFAHGPMPLYSTRTLAVGWDMWRLNEWLVPHLNGLPYSHKTPLLYWLYHAGWAVGGVNDVWPRIVHVLLATAVIALTALLARRLFERRAGVAVLAPWVMAGLTFFVLYALQLMFDVLLAVCVLLAFVALVRDGITRARPHWPLFALAVWLGLMTKGPVMLLHVAFPLLFAPLWCATARAAPRRWYGGALLALLAACAGFAAWIVPAILSAGPAYGDLLIWKQTTGRVVASFDHARKLAWYFTILPALLFPWALWPTWWRAQYAARGIGREPGWRFLLLWMLPTLLVFTLISGKQAYYLTPELPAFAIAVAAVIDAARARQLRVSRPWGFALAYLVLGVVVLLLPQIGARMDTRSVWLTLVGSERFVYGSAIIVLALLLLIRAEDVARATVRLGVISLGIALLAHLQFTAIAWERYDLAPAARVLAQAEREGRPIVNLSNYQGQFHFLGRLQTRFDEMSFDEGRTWAVAHPNGVLIQYAQAKWLGSGRGPLITFAFRTSWLEIWSARDWIAAFHPHLLPQMPPDSTGDSPAPAAAGPPANPLLTEDTTPAPDPAATPPTEAPGGDPTPR